MGRSIRNSSAAAVALMMLAAATAGCDDDGASRGVSGAARPGEAGQAGEPGDAAAGIEPLTDGFEGAGTGRWGIALNEGHRPVSSWPTIGPVSRGRGPAREGAYRLRFEITPRPGSFRSEITRGTVPMGSDCWYGFSVYVPRNWQFDQGSSILAQWHAKVGRPVKNFPVASLYLARRSWQVRMNWNSRGDTSAGPGWGRKKFRVGPARAGRWTDWVLHARWSYGTDGLLEVWRDDRRVVRHRGPTEYINDTGPYLKMGLYHPKWRKSDAKIRPGTKPLVSYADAIRFSCDADYAAVRPR